MTILTDVVEATAIRPFQMVRTPDADLTDAQAHQRDQVARPRNGNKCIPRQLPRDDAGTGALLVDRL